MQMKTLINIAGDLFCHNISESQLGLSIWSEFWKTSRDGPKSAPYPRLKNNKKTSRCQVLFYSIFWKIFSKKLHTPKNGPTGALKSHNAEKLKGGTLCDFSTSILSQNMKKIEENKNFHFREKISQCQKKLKGGTRWDFSTSILSQNIKKKQWGPFGEKFFFEKKVSQCRKKMKGGSLWSRPVWYVTRKNRQNLFGSVR